MLRRTASSLQHWEQKFLPQYTSKFGWTPEIRMLDKDERLPEVSMEQVIENNAFVTSGHQEGFFWPEMDPMNPTKNQKRVANTVQYRLANKYVSPHHMGFRTVPPELIDWRTSFYGDFLQELPTMCEKRTYSYPDYTLSGLLYDAAETKALVDAVPRTIEKASFSKLESPKHAAWFKYSNNGPGRNARVSFTNVVAALLTTFFAYKLVQYNFRQNEMRMRRKALWWDGANAGTWKYGGQRTMYWGQALSGGWVIPVLEW